MRLRTVGLLGIGAIAMVLVGCAHSTSTAPRISFLPDTFEQPQVQQKTATTAQLAKKLHRTESAVTVTRGRTSLGATARLTESGNGKLAAKRPSAHRAKSTRTGKKGNPSQLNVNMLIKMGGFAKLFGAADDTEKGNSTTSANKPKRVKQSGFITMANRAKRLTVKKKKAPMLNMNMLIKGGFYARMSRLAMQKRTKYNPGMLNLPMLIKMGGIARGMEKDEARRPKMRRVAKKLRSNAQYQRKQRVRKANRDFRMRRRINQGRMYRRQNLGGRCHGRSCRN